MANLARARRGKFDPREMAFLLAYYGPGPTKGNAEQSALAAGFASITARTQAARIVKRFGTASAGDSLRAVGVNKPYLAMRIRHVLENGGDKEILAAARLAYTLMGEVTGENGGVTINNPGPVMVVVGASRERIAALRSATPQPTREELEQLQNERVNERLERLRGGESFVRRPHSKALAWKDEALQNRINAVVDAAEEGETHEQAPVLDEPRSPDPSGGAPPPPTG